MFHLLRWPKRFHVMVRGSNFSLELGDEREMVTGFYTNRWVDAVDSKEAATKAFVSAREKLLEKGYGSILGKLELKAEKIAEVGRWRNRWVKIQGFVFYGEDNKESDGYRPPLH